jgi:hypothetical protein
MNLRKLISFVLAALVAASVTTTALAGPQAKKPLAGVWSGKTHQDLPPLGPDADFVEWSQRITIRANNGRLTYLGVNVRYTCPDPTNPLAGDIRLNLSWSVLKNDGPKLTKNGGFSLVVTSAKDPFSGREMRLTIPVHISGVLGAKGAGGRFDLSKGDCSGKGSWQAKRSF